MRVLPIPRKIEIAIHPYPDIVLVHYHPNLDHTLLADRFEARIHNLANIFPSKMPANPGRVFQRCSIHVFEHFEIGLLSLYKQHKMILSVAQPQFSPIVVT